MCGEQAGSMRGMGEEEYGTPAPLVIISVLVEGPPSIVIVTLILHFSQGVSLP